MSLVHDFNLVIAAQAAHRYVAVGPVAWAQRSYVKSAYVCRQKMDIRWLSTSELGIPKNISRGGKLCSDA